MNTAKIQKKQYTHLNPTNYDRDKSLKFLLSKSVPKETRPGIDEVWLHTNLQYVVDGVGGNHLTSALNY